jgi:hypothetical protein
LDKFGPEVFEIFSTIWSVIHHGGFASTFFSGRRAKPAQRFNLCAAIAPEPLPAASPERKEREPAEKIS